TFAPLNLSLTLSRIHLFFNYIMRKIVLAVLAICATGSLFAQSDSTVKKTILSSRALPASNDHLMIQVGYTQWSGKPDTISTSGIPRSLNIYFMLNFPFRTSRHMSAAIGVGVGSDHIFFDKTNIGIAANTSAIQFRNVNATSVDTASFKKYKLATSYFEVPVELRYVANPDNARSIKAALGVKVGFLVNAHTKGKNLENRAGKTINDFKQKDFSKKFFNQNRLSATARVGVGHFSLFGSYQVTSLFKEGLGPQVHPFTIGLNISGL
ncbi:MAG: hypothetical protein JWP27_1016, partial [Flaviaesturariibacter sp.]|nr:hypothetical protein [Flaviaesturariibacter sp.]